MSMSDFDLKGWTRRGPASDILAWAEAAFAASIKAVAAPQNAHWLQCEGTWFVGVDVLGNDGAGNLSCVNFPASLTSVLAEMPDCAPFHPAQVSVIYPGYPRPRIGESDAAFRYRVRRDAAHVDGLLPIGPKRRRMLREPHGYILGVPLTKCSADAAPLVVWEGSHRIMQRAFRSAFDSVAPEDWGSVDLTDVYQAARRDVFDACPRVEVTALPGEAYLIHRLALHGVAPWRQGAVAPPEGRMIAYLRPELQDIKNWPD